MIIWDLECKNSYIRQNTFHILRLVSGGHCDVKVINGKAYIFYHTHPGRQSIYDSPADENGVIPYSYSRSSIQVAELGVEDNKLIIRNRDNPFNFYLE